MATGNQRLQWRPRVSGFEVADPPRGPAELLRSAMPPPDKVQLVGPGPLALDHQCVLEHFLGLNQDDARRFYVGRMHFLAEDFMWMAPAGLRYYLPPVLEYLKSEEGKEDGDAAHGILCSLSTQIQLHSPLPPDIVALSQEICACVKQHCKRFRISPREELFREYISTIENA